MMTRASFAEFLRDPVGKFVLGSTYAVWAASRTLCGAATGKIATMVDELGRTTSYTYDALDRLVSAARPDATTTSQTYDAESERTSSTDPVGLTTTYQYDGAGRLTVTTHPDGTSMTTTYDAAGRSIATTDEAGYTSTTAYDADDRAATRTDALGNGTTYAYDAAGNAIRTTDPLSHATVTTYDADNRSVGTTYPDGTTDAVGYDAAGRMVSKTDSLGRITTYGYDADGRLLSVTDTLGDVTTYAYDEIGERVSQTDANTHVTSFAYDKRRRETLRTLPDASKETMTYDAAGEKVTRVDFNGKSTTYGYDLLSRLLSRTYATTSQNVAFTYTPDGRRATETDTRGTTTYAYDKRRRLTTLTYPGGDALSYAYDARGLRTGLTATIGSQSLATTTAYDADGRATSVQDPLVRTYAMTYDAASNRSTLSAPNTTSTSYGYDANNRMTSISTVQTPAAGGTPLTVDSFAYTLDADGKRTVVVESGGTARQYGYDGIDRLTSETVTGSFSYAKTFTYDPVGNRKSQVTTGSGAGSVPYTYDTRDRMLTSDGSTYTYDTNGNELTKSGEATYSYDLENRIVSVAETGEGTVAYTYDADGNRVSSVQTPASGPAVTTNALVDTGGGLSQVVAETDQNNNLTALYVRVGEQLLAVMRPGGTSGMWTTHFVHEDALGSVRAMTDEEGNFVDARSYEAFGTKNVETGTETLAYGFAGEALDATTHLAFHRARWMDSRAGRFAGMDPFAGVPVAPLSLQKYAYVANDPADLTDPNGMISPEALVVGAKVHEFIGEQWEAGNEHTTLNGRRSDVSIRNLVGGNGFSRQSNWLMKLYFGVSSLARPDLIATTEHAIYEIKALDEAEEGTFKVGAYLDLLQALDPASNWRAGGDDEYLPPSQVEFTTAANLDYLIQIDPPQSGVIVYVWSQYDQILREALEGVGIGLGAGAGIGEAGGSLGGVGGLL